MRTTATPAAVLDDACVLDNDAKTHGKMVSRRREGAKTRERSARREEGSRARRIGDGPEHKVTCRVQCTLDVW